MNTVKAKMMVKPHAITRASFSPLSFLSPLARLQPRAPQMTIRNQARYPMILPWWAYESISLSFNRK